MEELECVPWSDENDVSSGGEGALRDETATIRKELLALIEGKQYWTLASQPAANGVRSDDPRFGWGPAGGWVYQKPFVEMFVSRAAWEEELKPLLSKYPEEEISWFKTDVEGEFESSASAPSIDKTSSKQTPGTSGVNAVTWGVFRGREIVTPTIIEPDSFRAWASESYEIWDEWRRVFPKGSEEERFLATCRQEQCLVNVIGQKFVGEDGARLWEILAGTHLDGK